MFPEQGAQKVGMGKALAEKFDVCRQTFMEADDVLGERLSALCFEGPEDRLMLTENTQPAIMTVSVSAHRLDADKVLQACRQAEAGEVVSPANIHPDATVSSCGSPNDLAGVKALSIA